MADEVPDAPEAPKLLGEAAKGKYGVRTGDGLPADPSLAIFPIIRYDAQGYVHLLGTGFFITTNGLFVSARHVLMDTFDSKGRERFPIGIVQFLGKGENGDYIFRPILRCASHPIADVSVGVAAPMNKPDGTPLKNKILTLTTERVQVGERVTTFAYPRHANVIDDTGQKINTVPTWYDGEIEGHFPNGRDRVLLPGPCYQTSMVIHGGASGGPVFARSGCVFGINSTGYDDTNLSFVSLIDEIFQLAIDDVVMGTEPARRVPVIEMERAGYILVKPPLLGALPIALR
jgi:trypsin-like peptidase